MATGALVDRTAMEFSRGASSECQLLSKQVWRGSVQVIRHPNTGLFVTIVHERNGFRYDFRMVILRVVPDGEIGVRVQCLRVSKETEPVILPVESTWYQFPVGLTHTQGNQFLVTFGTENSLSFSHALSIEVGAQSVELSVVEAKDPYASIVPTRNVHQFFTLFVSPNGKVSALRLQQMVKCFTSLPVHFYHPGAPINLFTDTSHSFVAKLRDQVLFVNIVNVDMGKLFQGTPVEGLPTANTTKCGWKERSDLVRLILLWRWGGTWIDVDDIVIRPLPATPNVVPYLEWPNVTRKVYWGSNFELIDGKWKTGGMRNTQDGFHFQKDPMVNFHPNNPFVGRWIEEIVRNDPKCIDWGQVVPTDIYRKDPLWASRYINPLPQHSLLLHPAFGNAQTKGPMFPFYDYRLPADFPYYDTVVNQLEFNGYFKEMVKAQPLFAVKVKDKHYNLAGQGRMSIPAWVANSGIADINKTGYLWL